uniref:26S proteasome complex subunit SEM1 n=1 Tax=Poecilia mexicana TaxID=48701 RepID=A0A3B3WRZ3_9TELE
MSDKKQTVDLGLLEEDDEFEEFPAEDWTGLDEDEDAHVWEDNWDDDNVEDDFSNQLSRFLRAKLHNASPNPPSLLSPTVLSRVPEGEIIHCRVCQR